MTTTELHQPDLDVDPAEAREAAKRARASGLRGNALRMLREGGVTVGIAIAALFLAEWAAREEWVSPLILPRPSLVWRALVDGVDRGTTWPNVRSTLSSTLLGFGFASALSIALAGLFAAAPSVERTVIPFIVAFQGLPKIAVAPLIILWLGFDDKSKVVIVGLVCFFPILINSLQGMRLRDRNQLELMQSLGASRWQMFRYLRAPGSVPYVFAGLRVGAIFALIGAVVAEFVGTRAGLGYALIQEKANFNVPGVYANLVWLTAIGLLLHYTVGAIEKRVAFWTQDITTDPRKLSRRP